VHFGEIPVAPAQRPAALTEEKQPLWIFARRAASQHLEQIAALAEVLEARQRPNVRQCAADRKGPRRLRSQAMAEKFEVTCYDKEGRKVFHVIVKAVNSTVAKLYATAHLQARTRRRDVCGQGRGVRELRLVRAVLWSGTLAWLIYRTCKLLSSALF